MISFFALYVKSRSEISILLTFVLKIVIYRNVFYVLFFPRRKKSTKRTPLKERRKRSPLLEKPPHPAEHILKRNFTD
jgi:hypothetical protein